MSDTQRHEASYRRRELGRTPIGNRPVYGYTVKCSCGWQRQTNENKPYVARLFREHKQSA